MLFRGFVHDAVHLTRFDTGRPLSPCWVEDCTWRDHSNHTPATTASTVMNSFKSYFHPAGKKNQVLPHAAPAVVEKSSSSLSPPSQFPSRGGSRPASLYPTGDFRNSALDEISEIKSDVMVNYLHQQQLEHMWSDGKPGEGVILKKSRDQYTSCPADLSQCEGGFFDAVRKLNVRVGVYLVSAVTRRLD